MSASSLSTSESVLGSITSGRAEEMEASVALVSAMTCFSSGGKEVLSCILPPVLELYTFIPASCYEFMNHLANLPVSECACARMCVCVCFRVCMRACIF